MKPSLLLLRGALLTLALTAALPQWAADVVTLHSSGAGQLALTPEALTATRLKVTGHIDARDFKTLKAATLVATQELDLSEATIDAYYGTGGSYAPLNSDWFVGNEKPRHYRAGALPTHAFTDVADNTLSKWHYGSPSLRKIILPAGTTGVEPEGLYQTRHITALEVPEGATSVSPQGPALYDAAQTRLLALAPIGLEAVVLPPTVVSVADSALHGATLRGLDLRQTAILDLSRQGDFRCAYVLAHEPERYAPMLAGVDVTTDIVPTHVGDLAENDLDRRLKVGACALDEVRSLTVTGTLGAEDVQLLRQMPHLHFLNLSAARFSGPELVLQGLGGLCSVELPAGNYRLRIADCPFLGGRLDVPQGVTALELTGATLLTAVRLPASLNELAAGAFSDAQLESADLQACSGLRSIDGFVRCGRMHTLLLPKGLEELRNVDAPLEQMELPPSLRHLTGIDGWNVATLRLPASLETLSASRMWHLGELIAPDGAALVRVGALNDCPRLQKVDLSAAPLAELQALSGASALRELHLPATVQRLTGLEQCSALETLDLFGCSALRKLQVLQCPSLRVLKLPADLQRFEGLPTCTALEALYCAANEAVPALPDMTDGPLPEGARLIVPNGCRSRYAAAPGWARFGRIDEGGYTVRTAANIEGVVPTGAGLYAEGTMAVIGAPAQAGRGIAQFVLTSWEMDGNNSEIDRHNSAWATTSVAPSGHTTVLARYEEGQPALERGDMVFELQASAPGTLRLGVTAAQSDISIYNLDGLCAQGYSGETLTVPLQTGTNRLAVACERPTRLVASPGGEEELTLTDWQIKQPEGLTQLSLNGLGLTQLDVSPFVSLKSLDLTDNRLTALDVSTLTELESIDLTRNCLTTFDARGLPRLRRINVSDNRITTLRVPEADRLETLFCNRNAFGFSQVTQALYPLLVRSNAQYGIGKQEYVAPQETLEAGYVLDLSRETQAADGSRVDISVSLLFGTAPSADEGRYTLAQEGQYVVQMTCSAMPELTFEGYLDVAAGTGIDRLPAGWHLVQHKGRIGLSGLPDGATAWLLDATGRTIGRATGTEISLSVLKAGIYLVRVATTGGKCFTIKLYAR